MENKPVLDPEEENAKKIAKFEVIEGGRAALEGGPVVTNWLRNLPEGAIFAVSEKKYSDSWYLARKFRVRAHEEKLTELESWDNPDIPPFHVVPERWCQSYNLEEILGIYKEGERG